MRIVEVGYIHRPQRGDFVVCLAGGLGRLPRHEDFTLWRSCFAYSRTPTSNPLLIEAGRLAGCQLFSQNPGREILLC